MGDLRDQFSKQYQDRLWTHMRKDSIVRIVSQNDFKNREKIINDTADLVDRCEFKPNAIGYMSTIKGNGLSRFVPVLDRDTTLTYFACVQLFSEECSKNAVEGTYGGWSLGGSRRSIEQKRVEKMIVDQDIGDKSKVANAPQFSSREKVSKQTAIDSNISSMPSSPFNKLKWIEQWQSFWKVLVITTEDTPSQFKFVSLDIANFYDSIDLSILRRNLNELGTASSDCMLVLDELLSGWSTKFRNYERVSKGIPMDIVGDMSRTLANLYLTPADEKILGLTNKLNGKYLRWADDMVFCIPEDRVQYLLYNVCEILHEIGLNVNSSKVFVESQEEFRKNWGFDIMELLNDKATLDEGVSKICESEDGSRRKATWMKRALGQVDLGASKNISSKNLNWLLSQFGSSSQLLLTLNHQQYLRLFELDQDPQKRRNELIQTIVDSPFSEPKFQLLRSFEKKFKSRKPLPEDVEQFIKYLGTIENPLAKHVLNNSLFCTKI